MRFHSIRSIIFLCLAAIASGIIFMAPATAAPKDHGIYVTHIDVGKAVQDFILLADHAIVSRETAFFLNSDPVPTIGGAGNQRSPFDLKPEYAESYATGGLNFIDLRRRC